MTVNEQNCKFSQEKSERKETDETGEVVMVVEQIRNISERKKMENDIRENEAKFRAIFNNARDGIFLIDADSTFIDCNNAACNLYGCDKDELLTVNPTSMSPPVQPDGRNSKVKAEEILAAALRNEPQLFEWRQKKFDGTQFDVEIQLNRFELTGEPMLLAVVRDITWRKHSEHALQLERQKLLSMLENIPGFVCVQAPDHIISFANRYFREHIGEVEGRYCYQVFHGRDELCEECPPRRVFEEGKPLVWEVTCIDGRTYQVNDYPFADIDGNPQILQLGIDITERKRLEEALRKSQDELLAQHRELTNLFLQVEHQAHHDVLTSLPNRSLLADRIQQAILIARRNKNQVAVIFVDLDNLKFINDSMGHDFGDELLRTTAERLKGCVRASDTVARQGGDEFVIIISGTAAEDFVVEVAGKIREAISRPVTLKGHEMTVTCSIGISIFPKDGDDVQTLIKNADVAMYRAKEMGRDNFQFYSEELNARSMTRMTMERHLRRALENNEFTLHYQPKVSLRSGLITGLEALLRWQSPELGMVSPLSFIPLAEDTGLIGPIGEWVLRTACAQNRTWQESGLSPLRVAVNVSARQFKQANLVEVISRVLRETGLDPHYLELEISERAVVHTLDKMITDLNGLKAMGIHLAMDNFGSGYASLHYLKKFSFDKLKIDCSFIRDITSNPDSYAITRAVIAMAHSLHLKVIAEGVETEGQMCCLRDHGCDEMQGYYFSRPGPVAELTDLLRSGGCLKFEADGASSPEKSILVVDDEKNAVSAIERNLTLDGYRVLTAGSAMEGFELLATNRVAVVVSDQWMPDMNGNEFLSRVREMHPETVRILITGRGDLESVTDAINNGAIFKFLVKPWNDDFLRDTVGEALRHYGSLQHIE